MNSSVAKEVRVVSFSLPLGRVRIFYLSDFLVKLELAASVYEKSSTRFSSYSLPFWVSDLKERLEAYFKGERVFFKPPLYLRSFSSFSQRVYLATRKVPYGELRSYGWLAKEVGNPKAWRAVAQALKRNPFLIVVPCHRIVRSDGSLGGWSGEKGLKEKLLELEGSLPKQAFKKSFSV